MKLPVIRFRNVRDFVLFHLAILRWLPKYSIRENLKNDIIAGITCGITVIPQGMAYATIAGLPPIYGLYCALVPPFIYFFFGSSPQLIIGPTAGIDAKIVL
jgi:SulP family sulfate permease